LILEPTDWDKSQKEPSWRRLQTSDLGNQLVLMVNGSRDQEGIVLRKTDDNGSIHHAEFLCQVHIRRWRRRKLADVGPIRKEATTEFYRFADSQDGASQDGASKYRHFGSMSGSSTQPGSEASFTPQRSHAEPFRAFPPASSQEPSQTPSETQTPSQTPSLASRVPYRARAPAPSRADSEGRIKVHAERGSILTTIDNQQWILA
jgi:hypothetical protein